MAESKQRTIKPDAEKKENDNSPEAVAPDMTDKHGSTIPAHISVVQLLYDIQKNALDYQNLPVLLNTILQRSLDLTQYNSGSILLLTGPLGPLEVQASLGHEAIAPGTRIENLAASISGYVLRTQRPLVLAGDGKDIGVTWRTYTRPIPASICLALPGINGHAIGVLALKHTREPHFLTPNEFDILQLLASRYAVMIELAHLRDNQTQLLQGRRHSIHAAIDRPQISADSQLAQDIRQFISTLQRNGAQVTLHETPLPTYVPLVINTLLTQLTRQLFIILGAGSLPIQAQVTLHFNNPILSLDIQSWDGESHSGTIATTSTTEDIESALAEIGRLREHIVRLEGNSNLQIQPGVGVSLTVTLPITPIESWTADMRNQPIAFPSPSGTIARLVLAEPRSITRTGLSVILSSEPYLTTVAEVDSHEKALEICHQHQPDLLLLGVHEDTLAIEPFLTMLRQGSPATSIILIGHPHILQQFACVQNGDVSYLHAESSSEELLHAVRHIVQGHLFLDPDVMPYLASEATSLSPPDAPAQVDHLTRRELQVLHQLMQGKTNRQIADSLSIGAGTVKTHVERIIAKLQVSDRTQAAVRAFELGLLPDKK